MDLRVYHPDLVDRSINVNRSSYTFDEHGISPELAPEDYETFVSIPGYIGVEQFIMEQFIEEVLAEIDTLGAVPALPAEGEAPEPAEEEELLAHEHDDTLYGRYMSSPDQQAFYHALPLVQRLDLVCDHRFNEVDAQKLFNWENAGRRSKRVLSSLDARLKTLRKSKSAASVTQGMLAANYPHAEEA